MPTRRPHFVAVLVALVLLGAALGGCRRTKADRTADGRTPVHVFLLLLSTQQVQYYQWAEKAFEKANPDVDVVIEQFPGSSLKDFEIKLRLRFASEQAPDLFHLNTNVAAELAALGLLAPAPGAINAIAATGINPLIREAGVYDGTRYGIATDGAWTALYYNKAMFREAGLDPDRPPQTWGELLEHADRLTLRRRDGTPIRAGLSLRKSGFKVGTAEKWLTFLYSAGGQPFTEDGTYAAFDSDAGRAALDFYHQVLFERRVDAVGLEGDQQGFGQGRVAMFIREPHVIGWLHENYPDLEFGVAPIPKRDLSISAGGTYVYAVSADSPHQDAAWRFAEFVMSPPGYTRYAAAGGAIPTIEPVAELPRYAADSAMQVFLEQPVREAGGFPRSSRALDVLGAYIERFCYGHLTIEATLERAARDVDAVLAPNRRARPLQIRAETS